VNAGLCNDLLICKKESIWDMDGGLEFIDKYMEREEENI